MWYHRVFPAKDAPNFMPDSPLIAQARQGNPEAIATLLNRSFKTQHISIRVRRRQTRLYVQLTASPAPEQATVVPRIVNGLRRLQIEGIQSVDISAQPPGATRLSWRTDVMLEQFSEAQQPAAESSQQAAVPVSSSQIDAPLPPASSNPSPDVSPNQSSSPSSPPGNSRRDAAESGTTAGGESGGTAPPSGIVVRDLSPTPSPHLLPGWSFWFGWLVMTALGTAFSALLYSDISRLGLPQALKPMLSPLIQASLVGAGQAFVLRQEVSWSKQWFEATVIGGLFIAGTQIFWPILRSLNIPVVSGLLLPILTLIAVLWSWVWQWRVLRQHSDKADVWIAGGGAIALLFTVRQIGIFRSSFEFTLVRLIVWMVSGALMVSILRQSKVEELTLNRLTDASTRQRLLRQRAKVDGRFFLEWLGLTIAGWFVGGIVAGILQGLVITIPFTPAIILTTVTVFQWFTLKRRVPHSRDWFRRTAIAALSCTVIIGIIGLVLGGVWLSLVNGFMQTMGDQMLFWLSGLGVAVGSILLAWIAIIATQSRVLKALGYRPWWWLLSHIALLALLLHPSAFLSGSSTLYGLALWPLLLPSATMVWLLGYPTSLQSEFT